MIPRRAAAPTARRVAGPVVALAVALALLGACTAQPAGTPSGSGPAAGTPGTAPTATAVPATAPAATAFPATAPPTTPTTAPPPTLPRSLRHEVTTTTAPSRTAWPPCTEPTGRWVRTAVPSRLILEQPVQPLLVYEPPCYQRDVDRRYPTVWLFHGANTDETQWQDVGVGQTADRLIGSGAIPPVLIVLPDIIWGMGVYDGPAPLFDEVLLDELLPVVEGQWRTVEDRRHRAVGGISRGGEWALLVAGRHPEEFGTAAVSSAAVGPPSSPNSVLVPLLAGSRPRLWLDVGAADGLLGPVTSLSQALAAAGVAHELRTFPGGHDRAYWATHAEDVLRFVSAGWS